MRRETTFSAHIAVYVDGGRMFNCRNTVLMMKAKIFGTTNVLCIVVTPQVNWAFVAPDHTVKKSSTKDMETFHC